MTTIAINDRHPWERQPREGSKPYAAFALYRDLGVTRTMKRVAEHIQETSVRRGGTLDSIIHQLGAWSAKWRWQERIEEYDVYLDRAQLAAREDAIRQMTATHLSGAQKLVDAAISRMEELEPDAITDWTEAARLFETGVKTERLTRGLATTVEKSLSHIPASQVTRLVYDVVNAMLPFVPEDSQSQALAAAEDVCRNA